MDFRTLQYFVAVADELNFTRAAEKLQMSQPPLSNSIKQLEDDLGVQLFVRGKRKLTLTDAGELLLRRSRQIIALSDKTRMDLEALGSALSGQLAIGMVEGHAPFYVSEWIAGFSREYPQVQYDLQNNDGDHILSLLSRGLIDIALIARPYDHEHLDGIPVGREPWAAFMSSEHPLAKRPSQTIRLADLADVPLLVPTRISRRQAILRWFDSIGREPQIIGTLSHYIDAVALAESGTAISIFPLTWHSTIAPGIVSRVITDPAKYVEYVLVWNKETPPRGTALAFVEYVKKYLAENESNMVGKEALLIPEGAELL